MSERPILMCAPMVRLCLDDTKTHTRRTDPLLNFIRDDQPSPEMRWFGEDYGFLGVIPNGETVMIPCRFGGPGNQLWVRETWGTNSRWDDVKPSELPASGILAKVHYRADSQRGVNPERLNRWRPSIFMPRWASRLTLEIIGVRVERLQSISEEDAKAEGAGKCFMDRTHPNFEPGKLHSCREDFELIWKQINGPGSWALNPLVWVIEFKRIQP